MDLLRLDSSLPHDPSPLLALAHDLRAEFLRGVAYHLGAQIGDPLLNRDERSVINDADRLGARCDA